MVHPEPLPKREVVRKIKLSSPEGTGIMTTITDCETNEVITNIIGLTIMPLLPDNLFEGIITRTIKSKDGQGFYLVNEQVRIVTD